MHVRAAGFHADLAQNGDRAVAHDLIFLVGQRQGGGDGDRIARMHPHRIDVFDRADDDGVVGLVADHLHLELFPAEQGFIDQNLRHGRGFQTGPAVIFIIVAVIGHATAGAAKGEGRTDDGGQADLFQRVHGLFQTSGDIVFAVFLLGGGDDGGLGVFQTDAVHRFAEKFAILGHFNGLTVRADQFHAEFLKHAHVRERETGVQAGLPAHRGQQRVGAFLFDDLGHNLGGDRLDIGGVGQTRIGHDRRGVRVDEDDPVAFLAQRLARLRTGIVELAGLSDHDGTGSDDHDGGDIGSFRHVGPLMARRIREVAPARQHGAAGQPRAQILVGYRHPKMRRKPCLAVETSVFSQGPQPLNS